MTATRLCWMREDTKIKQSIIFKKQKLRNPRTKNWKGGKRYNHAPTHTKREREHEKNQRKQIF
jgi:hypothetical protein